ncbi:MAG: preprotein translocase subunit SecA [Candidatus Falkowbacteria bacterium]
MSIFTKIFGDPNEKIIKSLQPIIGEINGLEGKFEKMDDEDLKGITKELKRKLRGKETRLPRYARNDSAIDDSAIDDILPEAFAAVREASKRVLGQRHYDVQLMGGIILHRGQIAEMRTGEGKTLVATLPLYLNGLEGKGAHLITVNDYLSRVGAGWMAPVFYSLGMSTGVIVHDQAYIYDPEFSDDSQYDKRLKNFKLVERKQAYECDITYGTNNEFGFDYLRDNMAPNLESMSQRELHYSIVDEVDSILIDEARTPLIISAQAEESTDKYYKFSQLVKQLKENEDYNIDEKMRAATLTENGISKMEKWMGVENIYTEGGVREVHHIEQALKAQVLFKKDKDYVVKDNEVIIVDEFTGRLMHGRRYSEGLHQAIEAKEGVKIQRESQTLATITFQNYFRMYKKLAGMTGTALTEAEEFSKIYSLETVVIPTNKPTIRDDKNDLIYKTEDAKFKAVVEEIKQRNKKGQPVLVGTISIEKNELLGNLLEREGVKANILNAKHHGKEARIIEQAGKIGAVTIATNMAGRGVDIVLEEEVKKLRGLHVIGTERHEARRIDNQLRGRAGRQGDPGSSQFYVSMEDDLMRVFGGDRMKSLMTTLRVPEDMPIENKIVSRSIESAQKKVEGNNFDIRKHLVEYDDVINKHRESIYKKRREILESEENNKVILEMIEGEIEQVVSFHTAEDDISKWNIDEIYQVASTIFPVENKLKSDLDNLAGDNKLDKAKARTKIIESLVKLANDIYKDMQEKASEAGLKWNEIEKAVLIRSIDTLWIEHLDAMSRMRQGIGLRGYGQRDPLLEYKREAYGLYNELNNLIQKQVVYSIFKLGGVEKFNAPSLADRAKKFSAPAKTSKEKVGRNETCPCGSGKKYKKCCGK